MRVWWWWGGGIKTPTFSVGSFSFTYSGLQMILWTLMKDVFFFDRNWIFPGANHRTKEHKCSSRYHCPDGMYCGRITLIGKSIKHWPVTSVGRFDLPTQKTAKS